MNIAARLEAMTKTHHTPIIISEATARACKRYTFSKIGALTLKGRSGETLCYTPRLPG